MDCKCRMFVHGLGYCAHDVHKKIMCLNYVGACVLCVFCVLVKSCEFAFWYLFVYLLEILIRKVSNQN